MEKPLLILDIDETLVRAGDQLVRPPDFYAGDEFYGGYPVYKRPYLDQFLQKTSQLYKLAIWTSGGALYAAAIVAHIIPKDIPLEFVWSYERCGHFFDAEWRVRKTTKPLKKVRRKGYDIKRMLIVDNDAYKCKLNYGNAIYIKDFLGSDEDEELKYLAHYLESIADHPNYRNLEKRGWRGWAAQDLLK